MEEKLLTKADLGAFFQTSADAARKLCERHGIKPLNVGNGTVARLRWRLSDVMQVLAALQGKSGFSGNGKEFAELAGIPDKAVEVASILDKAALNNGAVSREFNGKNWVYTVK